MIVYRELSTLTRDLGFSARTLYAVSNQIGKHYRAAEIPARDGGVRRLSVPDPLLKGIQRAIYEKLLFHEEISPYASAYRPGGSTRKNARPHVGAETVLKLDIRHFFDSVIYPLVKEKAFPASRYSESNRILLTILCTCRNALPQGAPTSPAISNLILRDFDNTLGGWCRARGIAYTRYCDDMTFSGRFIPEEVISHVREELEKLGLYLNERKTVCCGRGRRKTVTGIVVNEKLSAPRAYKRRLRSELYYCRKFGVASHLARQGEQLTEARYLDRLLGRVEYVLSVEPDNPEMLAYRTWLRKERG